VSNAEQVRPGSSPAGAATPEILTIAEVVQRSAKWLGAKGSDTPRLDADILIGHALGLERIALYTEGERPLTPDDLAAVRSLRVAARWCRWPTSRGAAHLDVSIWR